MVANCIFGFVRRTSRETIAHVDVACNGMFLSFGQVGVNYNRDVRLLALFPAEVAKKLDDFLTQRDGAQSALDNTSGDDPTTARSRSQDGEDEEEDAQDKANAEDMKVRCVCVWPCAACLVRGSGRFKLKEHGGGGLAYGGDQKHWRA
jgi:hypothetical protein